MSTCPGGFYGYEVDNTCVDKLTCNNRGRFLYELLCISDCTLPKAPLKPYYHNGECIEQCPTNYFGYQNQGQCLAETECPENYFADETTHACLTKAQCNEALRSIYISSDGKEVCIIACSETDTYTSRKVLDHNGECISECPTDYFSYNDQGTCLLAQDCPDDTYGY